ncbi:energy-coupling factor transporter transmembrane component T family protein [Propionibacteriaceae bacterium G57]|uniref:energy-coupling factor transporter transmembrane component T family protein n=1 Tax=Aestuariimicrobium sp. G57 TaxID=3418485 RepID=UPI003DA6F9E1
MMTLYQPGHSLVHRCPAGVKLLVMLACGTAAFFVDDLRVLLVALGVVLGLVVVAGIRARVVWRTARAVLAMVALVVVLQGLLGDWPTAWVVGVRVLVVIVLASMITWTTTQGQIIDAVEWTAGPLRRFGVRPERIGLMIALVFRFVPVIAEESARVREAHDARGVRPGFSYLAPLVIRTLRMADGLGEALEARGVDDERVDAARRPS